MLGLVGILLMLPGVGFAEEGKNILKNGGFENARENPKSPAYEVDGWARNGNGTVWATDEVHSGKHSAKIIVTDLSTSSRYQEWKSELIPITGKIKVSAWVKTSNVIVGKRKWYRARVEVIMYDKNKKNIKHVDVCSVDGTTNWKKYKFEGNLHPDTKYIMVVCTLSRTTGIVWFDDLEVVSLSPPIPKEKNAVEKEQEREWKRLLLSKGERKKGGKGKSLGWWKRALEREKERIEIKDVILPPYKKPKFPSFFVKIHDKNFYRKGNPVFLLGVESGGILYPFLYRLLGIDFVCLDEIYTSYGGLNAKYEKEGEKWKVSWHSYPYLKTELKILLSNGIMPYISFAEGTRPRYNPLSKDFPELFAEMGHYLDYSPLNPVGERLRWNNRKSILKDSLSYPIFAYELFNEVHYRCHDIYNLSLFRKEMERKYKNIDRANQVWGTDFSSFSEVTPPNPGHSSAFLANMPQSFSRILFLDWMKFEEKIFGEYLKRSYKKMKKLAPDSYITIQSHSNLTLDYGNCGVYPGYKVKGEDIYGDEDGQSLFFQGQGKEDLDEINYMCRTLLRYDTVRHFSPDKPIIDEESCLTGRGTEKINEEELINFSGLWKFNSAKDISSGEKMGWNHLNYDDTNWGEIKVPGLWGKQGFAKTTVGWYRKKFTISKESKGKLTDGKRIYLKGKGLTDTAYIYLNGNLIYVTKTWNESFSLDVTSNILFGKENILAIKIINKYFQGGFYWGGIRNYLKLVISTPSGTQVINPQQMRTYLWSKVVHGYGGTFISYFAANEGWPKKFPPFSPYIMSREAVKEIPKAKEEINSVAKIILPRPRIKGQIAIVYPFETFRAHIPRNYTEYRKAPLTKNLTNYYSALLFSHIPLDVISSESILSMDINKYKVLVFANYKRTPPKVIENLKRYLREGGILIVSPGSFSIDDEFNNPLPTYPFGIPEKGTSQYYKKTKYGNGIVYYLKNEFNLSKLREIFTTIFRENNILPEFLVRDYLGKPLPFIEAHSFGRNGRYIWYFLNWGASSNASILPVRLSSDLYGKNFLIRDIETRKVILSPSGKRFWNIGEIKEGMKTTLKCQDPKIFIIEDNSLIPTPLKELDKNRKEILTKIWRKTIPSKFKVLIDASYCEGMPKEKIPTAVELLEKNGFGVYSAIEEIEKTGVQVYDGVNIKKDVLNNYQVLVFPCPRSTLTVSKFVIEKVKKFVKDGGGLFLLANFYHGPHGWLSPTGINSLSSPFGIRVTYNVFKDKINNELGEPLWVRFQNIHPHPITSGVKVFSSAGCGVLRITNKNAKVLIESNKTTIPPEQPVLAIREYGKGRVVVMGDGYWLEPETLKKGDNRQLLINIFNWLAKRI